MTIDEIEDFVKELDYDSRGMCVCPSKQTITCNDCYLCRVSYFNWVRQDLINRYGLTKE